jgi:hypothetical protein
VGQAVVMIEICDPQFASEEEGPFPVPHFWYLFGARQPGMPGGCWTRALGIWIATGCPDSNPPTTNTKSKLNTLGELLIHNVKDLYSAETQLVKALPKMAQAATDPGLQKGFGDHLEETKVHVTRLE